MFEIFGSRIHEGYRHQNYIVYVSWRISILNQAIANIFRIVSPMAFINGAKVDKLLLGRFSAF
jgi:hypothetical protein